MSYRFFAFLGGLAMIVMPLAAQSKAWSMPHTPDGQPDLQGTWTNATLTPLERGVVIDITGHHTELPPVASLTVSDAEAAVIEKRIADGGNFDRRDGNADADVSRAYNQAFIDRGTELARVDGVKRSSLIVDPPDGRVPPLTAEAKAKAAARPPANFNSVHDRPLGERCMVGFGSAGGPPMMPVGYNNNYQIVQTPGYVMILVEMIHEVRFIYTDGRAHLPKDVRQWLGDSIGHWEGDTLVVETTNFTNKTSFRGSDEHMRVIERFKRVDANTILYRATIDDPSAFSKQWAVEYPLRPSSGRIFEYACHEGNYAMGDILRGARKQEEDAKK